MAEEKVTLRFGVKDETAGKLKQLAVELGSIYAASRLVGLGLDTAKKAVAEFGVEQKAIAQLNQVLKSTHGISGQTSESLQGLAASLQNTSLYGDEAIVRAEALLLTFTNVREVFPEATATILDMAQAMGQDLQQTTIQVGKALQDPIAGVTALRRVGVQLSQQQEDQIRQFMAVNDVMSAQKIILAELSTQFGGQASAAAQTYAGQIERLGNLWSDLREAWAEAVLNLANISGGFDDGADSVGGLTKALKEALGELTAVAKNMKDGEIHTAIFGFVELLERLPIVGDNIAEIADRFGRIGRDPRFEAGEQLAAFEAGLERLANKGGVRIPLEFSSPGAPSVPMPDMGLGPKAGDWADLVMPAPKMDLGWLQEQQDDLTAAWLERFQSEEEALDVHHQIMVDRFKGNKDALLMIEQLYWDDRRQLREDAADEEANIQQMRMDQELGGVQQLFGSMAAIARASGAKNFRLYQGLASTEAFISTQRGVAKALGEYPPPLSFIFAASVLARGIASVIAIQSQRPPSAHAGMTSVPEDATYALRAGERVLTPAQNRDLTDALARRNEGGPVALHVQVNVKGQVEDIDWQSLVQNRIVPEFQRAVDGGLVRFSRRNLIRE